MSESSFFVCDLCGGVKVEGRCPWCDEPAVIDLDSTTPIPNVFAQRSADADPCSKNGADRVVE